MPSFSFGAMPVIPVRLKKVTLLNNIRIKPRPLVEHNPILAKFLSGVKCRKNTFNYYGKLT